MENNIIEIDGFTYHTEPPLNDDFDINQWCVSTERREPEIFQIESMTCDWLIDRGGKQYDPDYCEVIVKTDNTIIQALI
jgi:hypothetical protein